MYSVPGLECCTLLNGTRSNEVLLLERRIESRQLLNIMTLFLIAQFGGLFLIFVSFLPSYAYIAAQPIGQGSYLNPTDIVVNLVTAILFVYIIIRFYRADALFQLFEFFFVIIGSFFFFIFVVGDLLPNISTLASWALPLFLALLLLGAKRKYGRLRNMVTIISSIGYGILIGIALVVQLGFIAVYAFMAIVAVYDYIAVFVLKFMIPFARRASSMNLSMMIGSANVEFVPGRRIGRKEAREYRKMDFGPIDKTVKGMISKGNAPMISSMLLGNGDIMLPIAVAVGAYIAYFSYFVSVMIALGAAMGLLFTTALLKKYKVGLPAIPPLFAFVNIFLAIAFAFTRPWDTAYIVIFVVASLLSILAMLLTLRKMFGMNKART